MSLIHWVNEPDPIFWGQCEAETARWMVDSAWGEVNWAGGKPMRWEALLARTRVCGQPAFR